MKNVRESTGQARADFNEFLCVWLNQTRRTDLMRSRSFSGQSRITSDVFLNNIQDNPRMGRSYGLFVAWRPVRRGHKQHGQL